VLAVAWIGAALGRQPKAVELSVALPVEQAAERSTYRAGASSWHPRNRRAPPLASRQAWLSCSTEGSWLTAEVAFTTSEFPSHLPIVGTCASERMEVTVTVTGPSDPVR
jgi:hypothetical protein